MPSRLFKKSEGNLSGPDKAALGRFLTRLSDTTPHGKQRRRNLESESHLVGNAQFADPAAFREFLEQCVKSHKRRGKRASAAECFLNTCPAHSALGLQIPFLHIPDQLLRYTTSTVPLAQLLKAIAGKKARRDFEAGRLTGDEAIRILEHEWTEDRIPACEGMIASPSAKVVFATFKHDGNAPRNDANKMAAALALECATRPSLPYEALYEFSYAKAAVSDFRFPTVADAGSHHLFKPAKEIRPKTPPDVSCWGRTGSLHGEPSQPEVVHRNEKLSALLTGPPRLVGRLTL